MVELNEEQMGSVINVEQLNIHMQKAIGVMKDEFVKNLSLRSTTGAIETLKIGVDGKDFELQELGQIVRKNPKTIVINMVAFPQTIPQVFLEFFGYSNHFSDKLPISGTANSLQKRHEPQSSARWHHNIHPRAQSHQRAPRKSCKKR